MAWRWPHPHPHLLLLLLVVVLLLLRPTAAALTPSTAIARDHPLHATLTYFEALPKPALRHRHRRGQPAELAVHLETHGRHAAATQAV